MAIRHLLHVFLHGCSCCRSPSNSDPAPTTTSPSADLIASAAVVTLPDHQPSSSSIDHDQRLRPPLEFKDLTVEGLEKLIDHLQSRLSCVNNVAPSDSPVHGVEDSSREWEKYTSNIPSFLQDLDERKREVTAEGVLKDTVLPLLVKVLEGVAPLQWAAFGFSMLAWGIDILDKTHENFEDCVELLKNTLFLLKYTRRMWMQDETIALDDLMQSNFPRIAEAAFKASVICASCCLVDNASIHKRYLDMVRAYLGAASLEASIGKLKDQIRDLMLQNIVIDRGMEQKAMEVTRQLSRIRSLDNEGDAVMGWTDLANEIEEILGQDRREEIVAVCLHGMGGAGKSTLALQVFNAFLKQKQRFAACSRIELRLENAEIDIPRLQMKILKEIKHKPKTDSKVSEGKLPAEGRISDALEGREQLQRAFEKSSGPIFLYVDNVQQPQHLRDLLPKVQHLPKGSRLLITTRNEKIIACLGELGVMKDRCHSISLDNLGTEESRALLRKWALSKAGNEVVEIMENDETLKDLEDEVLDLCNGLPLALKFMGSYISYSGAANVETWRHVVESMKEGRPIDGDKNNELYARLRVSIDVLDEGLRRDLFDMVACNYFQYGNSRWEFESILGADGMQNLMDLHILEDEGEDDVGCHDVIQSLVRHLAMATDELNVTGGEDPAEPLRDLSASEQERVVCVEGVVMRDVQLFNRMKRLRFAVNVRVEMDEAPPAQLVIEIDLPHLKVLKMNMYEDDSSRSAGGGGLLHYGPVVKLRRCPELRVLEVVDDVVAWQELFSARKLRYLHINNCKQFQETHFSCFRSTTSLRHLILDRCDALAAFPPITAPDHLFGSLRSLYIHKCPNLREIPETIHTLSQLTSLTVSGCKNLTRLPSGIGQLKKLEWIWIGECPRLGEIPETVQRLSQLTCLSVTGCENLPKLPNGIGQLKKLEWIWINECPRLGEIPDTIHRLSQLTYLGVMWCTSLARLPSGIGQLTNLQTLSFHGCSGLQRIPDGVLENLAGSLSELYLSSCWRLQTLPDGISLCTSLTILDLEYCASLQCIPIGVGQLTNLETLDFHGCTSLPRLPDGVFQNLTGSLSSLDLQSCTRLEMLPEGFSSLRGLMFLRLGKCRSLRCIPEGIQQVVAEFETLDLSGCASLQKLPSGMFDNLGRSLSVLNLSNCERLEMLPEGISLLTSLTELRLDGCRSLQCIPEGIEELASLQYLNLRGCGCLHELPYDMFKNLASSLSELDLSFCGRLEVIPEGISGLTSLTELRLEQCESLQRIPEGVMELPSLQTLNLRGCSSLLQEGLPHGAFQILLGGSLLMRERKLSKKKNLQRHLLYMVSI